MSGDNRRSREAEVFLDNLTEFLTHESVPIEEIKERLRNDGIDPAKCIANLRDMLAKHAPTWQEQAAREREETLRELSSSKEGVRLPRDQILQKISELVTFLRDQGTDFAPTANYRNPQEFTDEDLMSLLEDLQVQVRTLKR